MLDMMQKFIGGNDPVGLPHQFLEFHPLVGQIYLGDGGPVLVDTFMDISDQEMFVQFVDMVEDL
jgi:hypothetical protein